MVGIQLKDVRVQPTFAEYQRRRLGRRGPQWHQIVRMVGRSFGAPTFAAFWRYWNPLFGYYLYYRCYRPLIRIIPRPMAVIATFAASGVVHDLFATVAVQRPIAWCTGAFTVFGVFVVAEEGVGWNLRRVPRWLRPLYHFALIATTVWVVQKLRGHW